MNGSLLYLDASAVVKLVVAEPESGALVQELGQWPERVSSVLIRVEVPRALARAGATPAERKPGGDLLDRISLLSLTPSILGTAADLPPPRLSGSAFPS